LIFRDVERRVQKKKKGTAREELRFWTKSKKGQEEGEGYQGAAPLALDVDQQTFFTPEKEKECSKRRRGFEPTLRLREAGFEKKKKRNELLGVQVGFHSLKK